MYHLSNHNFLITLKCGGCLLQDGCQLLAVSTPGGIELNKNCNRTIYINRNSSYYIDFHHRGKGRNIMLSIILFKVCLKEIIPK
jgi:hypothetical protein